MIYNEIISTSREHLRQELMNRAKLSKNRFIEWAVRAAYMAKEEDKKALTNCDSLSVIDMTDALQMAFEAGQLSPTGEHFDDSKIQDGLCFEARLLMQHARHNAIEAEFSFLYGDNQTAITHLKIAHEVANRALETAVKAGKAQNKARRDEVIPTLTLWPET